MAAEDTAGDSDHHREDWRLMAAGEFDLEVLRRQIARADALRLRLKRVARSSVALEVARIQGIIDSMTPAERQQPQTIGDDRCARIARGAGVSPGLVRALIKQCGNVAALAKRVAARPREWPLELLAQPDTLAVLRSARERGLLLWECLADT